MKTNFFFGVLLYFILHLQANAALNGTYTIDPSASASSNNYLNFRSAISDLSNGTRLDGGVPNGVGVTGAVIFNVANGTYNEQITLNSIPTTTAARFILFQSASGNPNLVQLNFTASSAANNFTVNFNGANFIKFKNITISALGLSFGRAVVINNNSSNDSFFNVRFVGAKALSINNNMALVGSYSTIKFDNWCFDACQFINGSYGAYMQSRALANTSLTSLGLTYKNCRFLNQYAYGMYNSQMNGLLILNNIITSNSILNSFVGIYNYSIMVLADANKTLIIGNRIYGTIGGYGIFNSSLGDLSTVTAARRPLIANNMIQIGVGNNPSVGIRVSGDNGSDYYHNSVNITSTNTSSSSAAAYFESAFTNTVSVVNNSFYSSNGSPALFVSNDPTNGLPRFTPMNYNNIRSTGTNLAYYGGSPSTSLAAWQNLVSREANSVSVDPFYSSISDLHSNQTAMNNAGLINSLVTTDFDGQARCPIGGCPGATSNPDIGADEFILIPRDASISDVVSPTTICTGSGASNVLVNLKNLGTNNLTSADIQWSVNGAIQPTFSWSGNLTQGQIAASLNLGSFNFVLANNEIKVWTANIAPGPDQNITNDTLYFYPNSLLKGTYTIGGVSPNFISFTDAVSTLMNLGVCGDVTFNVRQGTYFEKIQINAYPGASAANFVTFQADPANTSTVVLTDNTNTSAVNNNTLHLNGVSFIQFRNLTLTNTSASAFTSVLRFTGTQDSVIFKNNIINGVATTVNSIDRSVINHDIGGSNMIRRFVLDGNQINNGAYGIYLDGNSTTNASTFESKNYILNNRFNNQSHFSIFARFQRNIRINNNTIDMGASTNTGSRAIDVRSSDTFFIERNNISRFGLYGVYLEVANFQFGTGNFYSTIVNNMIGGRHTSTSATGIHIQPGNVRNIRIYHNSVSVNSWGYCLFLQQTTGGHYENIDIRNNSFANFGTGYSAYMYASPVSTYTVNYNNYHSAGTWNYILNTSSYNIANGGSPTYNANSKVGNPNYSNNLTNLRAVYSTQLSNSGQNLASVTSDIQGDVRPLTPSAIVDIGADEFNIPVFDAAITSIQTPLGFCPTTAGATNVFVTLQNVAATTLTSAKIRFAVDGVDQSTYNWSGSLTQGQSQSGINIGSYTFLPSNTSIKVWVFDPNNVPDENNPNDTITSPLQSMLSGVYTIGGITPDYANFTQAFAALNTNGVCGSVTFNVRQGTYTEKVTLSSILGASASNYITFRADPTNTTDVILTNNGTAVATITDDFVLKLDGTSFIEFRGLTISNTSTGSFRSVIRCMGNQDSVVFRNNILTSTTTTAAVSTTQVVINHSTSATDMINRFMLENNTINGGSYGVYIKGNTSITVFEEKNRIKNNVFNNQFSVAIFAEFQKNLFISGNTIDMGAATQTTIANKAIDLNYCDLYRVESNNIRRFGYHGLFIANGNFQGGTGTDFAWIVNNMIGGQNLQVTSAVGMLISPGNQRYTKIYQNSVSITTTGFGIHLNQSSANQYIGMDIQNNSFANFGTGMAAFFRIALATGTPYSVNYNNYFSAGTNYYLVGTTTFAIGNSNGGSPTYNANSRNGNPQYISNSTNLHSISAQLNNVGNNAVSMPTDIDGDVRPLSPSTVVDIGADEFNIPVVDNVGVTMVNSPTCPVTTGLQNVQVTINNFGTAPLNNVVVKYKVGKNGTVRTVNWTSGPLAPNASIGVLFTGGNQHNFTGIGIDTVFSWTEQPNGNPDLFTANDTGYKVFYYPLNGTYTIGGTTPNFVNLSQAADALNCAGVSGPVVFNIRTGTYTDSIDLGVISGASSINTVIFKSQTGIPANVQWQRPNSGLYNARLTNTKHVTFKDLTVIKTDNGSSFLMQNTSSDSVHNIEIRNCDIKNTWNASLAINIIGKASKIKIVKNTISNSSGINIQGLNNPSDYNRQIVIDSNSFPNIAPNDVLRPVQMSYCNGPKITNNSIAHRTSTANTPKISLIHIIGNTEVAYNTIHSGTFLGCLFQNINTAGDGSALIHNNFVANNNTSSNAYCVTIAESKNIKFYNNSLYQHANVSSCMALRVYASNVSHTDIKIINNNLITNTSSLPLSIEGSSNSIAINQINECDFNNYFVIGGSNADLLKLDGVGVNLLSSMPWQIYPSSDDNSINVNPGYTNANDNTTTLNLRLASFNSPVVSKAKSLTEITRDIDNNNRKLNPDIGAFETNIQIRSTVGDYTPACVNLSGSSWIDLYDNNGHLIMSINPNGNNLGSTCYGVRILSSPDGNVRVHQIVGSPNNYGYILDRNYFIKPTFQPSSPVGIKFYFLNSELDDIVNKTDNDNVNTQNNTYTFLRDSMIITKYSGYVNNLNPTDSFIKASYISALSFTNVAAFTSTSAVVQLQTSSFSEFIPSFFPFNTMTPLPVVLIDFEAEKENKNAIVKWMINNDFSINNYELERSFDGFNFNYLEKFDMPNSQGMITQEFLDESIGESTAVVYYRLKMTGVNGQIYYSDVKEVWFQKVKALASVYPNPNNGIVSIISNQNTKRIESIMVRDLKGKLLKTVDVPNVNSTQLNIEDLANGVYFLDIIYKNDKQTLKIIKF